VNTLSRIISVLFHPLLMATYLVALLSFTFPPALYPIKVESRWTFLVTLFVLTSVLPAINIGLFKVTGVISSFSLEDRRERIRPSFFILLLYGLFTYLLSRKGFSLADNLFKLILIIDALVLIALLVTVFYKASIHSLGVWGIIGILMPLNKVVDDGSLFLPTLLAIVGAGVIMSARLKLNAHSPREVLVGSLAGFVVGFLGMLILF
jgi:hypothetical protein